jgi:hypothetical protein
MEVISASHGGTVPLFKLNDPLEEFKAEQRGLATLPREDRLFIVLPLEVLRINVSSTSSEMRQLCGFPSNSCLDR